MTIWNKDDQFGNLKGIK